jgi:4-coumarate--CoA ligase (photoactive yellow protein activation family)
MTTITAHAPEELVAVGDGAPRTAAQLEADAGRVAAALAELAPGEVVVVCSDRYRFAAAMLGAWAAGHAVRLPPSVQPEVVRTVASSPEVRGVLHDRDGAPGGADVRALLERPATVGPLPPLDLERRLLTVMTSGSTGVSQAWHKTGRQLLDEADVSGRLFGPARGGRVLATVPAHHIYGLQFGVLVPLRTGGVMVRSGALHAEEVMAEIARHAAAVLVSVPAHLASLTTADAGPPLSVVYSAGAPLPAATARALRDRHGWPVVEIYGTTETGGIAWRRAGEETWATYPGVTASAGADGGLLVDSPWLEAGRARPFPVADRVELRPGGGFVLLGRMDGVAKVAGKRVSLREVEERLLALPGVRDAAALARPSPGLRGEEIWVAVVAHGQTPERLREALAGWFDPVALPRRIRVIEALPREATGKIARERLMAVFEMPAALPTRMDPEAEERLAAGEGRDARKLTFTIPADLRWFDGHFPGNPVLPGVAQLDGLVARQVERLWPDAGALRAVKRLKFSQVIRPGERISVLLDRDADRGIVAFSIEGREGRCASGTLVFGPGEGE